MSDYAFRDRAAVAFARKLQSQPTGGAAELSYPAPKKGEHPRALAKYPLGWELEYREDPGSVVRIVARPDPAALEEAQRAAWAAVERQR